MNSFSNECRQKIALILTILVFLGTTAVVMAQDEPLRVRRNFMGMHNLKGGGVTPFQTGMDWTKTLVNDGFIMEWVSDYAPEAPDHWIAEAMARDLVPVVRVQQCQPDNDDCAPSVGYSVNVAAQILDWKVAHPAYANRLVYMQLWNEPGDARDFVPMDEYADFLVAAYRGIRQIENEYARAYPALDLKGTLQVMTPGQNDGWDTAFNHNPQAKFSFDVWATHPYPDMTPPWYNIHDGDYPSYWLKSIDGYIQDLDEVARTHNGVPGRRGFPVMITETCYGWFVGHSTEGWPKLTQEARAPFTVDAFFKHWYQWPEIIAVHPFLLSNVKWPGFEFVHSWTSQDVEYPFGVLEPANPYPVFSALKEARQEVQARGELAPARLVPYRGPVGKITGQVTRKDTGEPVPYATIYTDGYEFGHLTLYDGIYEIPNVPVGTYTLSFQKASYLPVSRTITVTEGQALTADFDVTFTGKTLELLYSVRDTDGICDENCANLNAVDHWQSFMTGPDTGFIKFAACQVHGEGVTMQFSIHEGGPGGPQVGPTTYSRNPVGAGDQMIGWEWPDGQEPRVEPNTRYWLHFQREDGQAIYTYASNANPYLSGNSSSSGGVDFYGTIYGLTREVNLTVGTLSGTVTDTGGLPISGASVTCQPGGCSAVTDGNGSYTIRDIPAGSHSLTVSGSGYQSQTMADIQVNQDGVTVVDFSLVALPPAITLSVSSLNPTVTAGDNAANDAFTVRNSGGGMLNYSIGKDAGWLTVNPASGTGSGETDSIVVQYHTAGLPAGVYNAVLTVADPAAVNTPRKINLVLTVKTAGPAAAAAEDFESLPDWTSAYDASWGGAAAWSTVGGGQAGQALQASRSRAGSSSKVMVYDIEPNRDYTLSIFMRSAGAASAYWAECGSRLGRHSAGDFDASPAAWSLIRKFSNSGVNGNANTWTRYAVTFNSGGNTAISIGFKLGSSGSAPVVQWDTLRLVAEGSAPQPQPTIGLSTASLAASVDEGLNAPPQNFEVANSGDGSLNYTVSTDAGWLSVNPAAGTSTGEADLITVSYASTDLPPGTYTGIVTVADPAADNHPQTVSVSLTVKAGQLPGLGENFENIPGWTHAFDAAWGSSAAWTIVGGGQAGNALQATRSSAGSSSRVLVYDIQPQTAYTISVYMRSPGAGANYWAECALRPGNYTAQDFDAQAGAWTMIKKFTNAAANGTGDQWVRYALNFSSGGHTQLSVGFKLGSSASAPVVSWDSLKIE